MIDKLHAQMISGLQLENHTCIGGRSSRVRGTLIIGGDGSLADFVDPRGGTEGSEMNCVRPGDDEKVEEVIAA
jgi:hypothetical protein